MDESDDAMSVEVEKKVYNPPNLKVKPKKRSLVERELETNLTARITSPAAYSDGTSTSRYGRARRLKTDSDFYDSKKSTEVLKTLEKSPITNQSPVYKMHASNSPLRSESPKKGTSVETFLENQIENIYQENISLSRFNIDEVITQSPAKKFPKVYIRKDLIQKREPEETIMLIKNMFSPTKSSNKTAENNLSNAPERSSEKCNNSSNPKQQNGYIDNTSVVKMLDFDSKKKKKENKDSKTLSKTEIFDLEAKCLYQVGDIAWARMGTFPFWPCIISKDPASGIFVKKKLFGRVEHDVIHVTFLGDNGRRSWIVDNMLKKYLGHEEFVSTREQFTAEHKKRDPRLYAAFFVSEKKQPYWNISVEEAEILLREPKRLRIDIFNDMLEKSRIMKTSKHLKGEKIRRTDSDVSLSESLFDTLFSEDDGKTEDTDRSRNKSRNKSLDVSDVVTACLDNMAAKTGITKIQRQSHMDRWLQKAKSKTPEKVPKTQIALQKTDKVSESNKKKKSTVLTQKPYSFRKSANESPKNSLANQNEHDYSKYSQVDEVTLTLKREKDSSIEDYEYSQNLALNEFESSICNIDEIKTLPDKHTFSNSRDFGNTKNIKAELTKDDPKKFNVEDKDLDLCKNNDSEMKTDESDSIIVTKKKNQPIIEDNICREDNIKATAELYVSSKEIVPIVKDKNQVLETTNIGNQNAINELREDKDNSLVSPIVHTFHTKNITANHDTVTQIKSEYNNAISNPNEDKNRKKSDVDINFRNDKISKTDFHMNNTEVIVYNATNIDTNMSIHNVSKTEFDINDIELKEKNNIDMDMSAGEVSETGLNFKNNTEVITSNQTKIYVGLANGELSNLEFDNQITEKKYMCSDKTYNFKETAQNDMTINASDELKFQENQISSKVEDIFLDSSNKKEAPNNLIDLLTVTEKFNDTNKAETYKETNDYTVHIQKNCESGIFDDEDTSDEEPSPEYEPIGAEVAEEFPKYILSAENKFLKGCSAEILKNQDKKHADVEKLPERIPLVNHVTSHSCSNKNLDGQAIHSIMEPFKNNCHKSHETKADSVLVSSENYTGPLISSNNEDSDIKENKHDLDKYFKSKKDLDNNSQREPKHKDVRKDNYKKQDANSSGVNKIMHQTDKNEPIKNDKNNEIYFSGISTHKDKMISTENHMGQHTCLVENVNNITHNNKIDQLLKENEKPIKANKICTLNDDTNPKYSNLKKQNEENQDIIHNQNILIKNVSEVVLVKNSMDKSDEEDMPKKPNDNNIQRLETGYDINCKISKDIIYSDKNSIPKVCASKRIYMNNEKPNKKSKPKIVSIENNLYETYLTDVIYENSSHANTNTPEIDDDDFDIDAVSINSEDSEISWPTSDKILITKRKLRSKQKKTEKSLENPEFLKYLELRQDSLMDEHPELSEAEIVAYLYQTWLYEENAKSNTKRTDDIQQLSLAKSIKEGSMRKKKTNSQPKTRIDNYFCGFKNKNIDSYEIKQEILSEHGSVSSESNHVYDTIQKMSKSPSYKTKVSIKSKHGKTNEIDEFKIKEELGSDTESIYSKANKASERALRSKVSSPKKSGKKLTRIENKKTSPETTIKDEVDSEPASENFVDIEVPLLKRKVRIKEFKTGEAKENSFKQNMKSPETTIKTEIDDTEANSINSEDSDLTLNKLRKPRLQSVNKKTEQSLTNPEFIKYLELRQDALTDENPQLNDQEITTYLFKTWLYEENAKSDLKKTDDIEQAGLVKGLKDDSAPQPKRTKKKVKAEKDTYENNVPRNKPKRKIIKPYYNEEFSDIEDELETFEIFKSNEDIAASLVAGDKNADQVTLIKEEIIDVETSDVIDEVELYFLNLAKPKPNVFKGLVREKVCEICEQVSNLVKCKSCNNMYHIECVKKEVEVVNVTTPSRGRKKKKKLGRRPKSLEGSESQSDDKPQDVSDEMQNISIDEIMESGVHTVDADTFEMQLSAKMKELMDKVEELHYDSYSSDDGVDWSDCVPGKCKIVDVKLKRRSVKDYPDFKCNNCQKHDTPVCFVCKSSVSKTEATVRQKCHVAHCYKYYHSECLDHWPQTQFSDCDPSRTSKKTNAHFEIMACPRHVCHTCVSDDPRGCKTRFSGDKLARCVRCPATYHSFTKCLPAGTQILTGSHIICPRHYDHRLGKIPCHVNTGWCFICALGGSLICCEYCPTSFHAECLNIKPPEGGYMCEDCETGRLPLYGEMVWVKLGHYRWWPGIILHPSEIPENLMAVKHGLGEFVVRFFGQYDHYWVNRGRVFPFQEGDSGRISSQKSKIDEAFTMAMQHAHRACEVLKSAKPNEEESMDIASSLLPPHYVKLKANKPCGALCGRRVEDPSLSLTQCDCDPTGEDPCGPLDHCLNRMLLTECGPTCRSGERCNNRAFERRRYPRLAPYRTPHRGWGLKTLEDIKAGQFVIEYVGELIDEEEFKRRMRRMHEIRDENFYFLTLDKERMIDAGPKGNLARFMNHSCEPNCETQKWTVLGDVRVGLFALRDIPANSEVTFNYNLECAGIDKKRCLCGAKRCSGYIGAKPKQDESQSKKSKDGKVPAKRAYKKRKNVEESPSTSKIKPKRPLGRPPKPKELTEIEKDLLIIKNATTSVSSDESTKRSSPEADRNHKALKRKRVNFSSEENILNKSGESQSLKKPKLENEKVSEVGD